MSKTRRPAFKARARKLFAAAAPMCEQGEHFRRAVRDEAAHARAIMEKCGPESIVRALDLLELTIAIEREPARRVELITAFRAAHP